MTAREGAEMSVVVLVCGNVFDGISDTLTGPAEILVEGNRIGTIERSLGRPPGARVIDLPERTPLVGGSRIRTTGPSRKTSRSFGRNGKCGRGEAAAAVRA
jgi:hypothetical protein